MPTTRLRKVGGSSMIALPPAALEALRLKPGSVVTLTIRDGSLVVEPQARPLYRLEDLLAQCEIEAEMSQEDKDWIHEQPKGRELI